MEISEKLDPKQKEISLYYKKTLTTLLHYILEMKKFLVTMLDLMVK